MTEKEALIFLNLIEDMGPVTIRHCIDCVGSAAEVINASLQQLRAIPRLPERLAHTIKSPGAHNVFEEEMRLVKAQGVEVLSEEDTHYPLLLKEIAASPVVLYVKGTLPVHMDIAIAVVGARYASCQGIMYARTLAEQLAQKGFTIVSGFAQGIDKAAHQGALAAGGSTVAVLGSGLLSLYPVAHAALAEKMVASTGALISEFPLKMQPLKGNFPRRNRIISGLSLGVIVVEAARKSGSLITARYALEQNRQVYAVPGSPQSLYSLGTNHLIQEGAKLITCEKDIIEDLYPLLKERLKKIGLQSAMCVSPANARAQGEKLSAEQQLVLEYISQEPIDFAMLIAHTKLSFSKLSLILVALELEGRIQKLPGEQWIKK